MERDFRRFALHCFAFWHFVEVLFWSRTLEFCRREQRNKDGTADKEIGTILMRRFCFSEFGIEIIIESWIIEVQCWCSETRPKPVGYKL